MTQIIEYRKRSFLSGKSYFLIFASLKSDNNINEFIIHQLGYQS